MAYDENQWASSLNYHEQNVDDALALFKSLRHTSYTLIKTLPEHVWAHTSFHPENGETPRRLAGHVRETRPRAHRVHAGELRGLEEGKG